MGRYKNPWYGFVLQVVKRYPGIKSEETIQAQIFIHAIEKALREQKELKHGEERLKAFKMIYFDKSHNIDGAAQRLYFSRKTVENWCRSFIKMVMKYSGFV